MAGTVSAPAGAFRLPPLREDLKLLPGPTAADGAPTWTLHDPARHRFFRIGWMEFEILSRWLLGHADAIATSVANETTLRAREDDVASVLRFAGSAGLLAPRGEAGTRRLLSEAAAHRVSPATWLLHNYLFFRIRLINPDRLLAALLPWLGWIYTRGFAVAIALLGLLGLHLVGQQWDLYRHSFLALFSWQGAAMVGLALGGAKVVHEFGHGLTTKRFGCRVPAMGFALLVLWPVLWTDTTDAWRLTDRRQRLAIDAAGVAAEIVLAVLATLAWAVLPDGPARSAAFLLSSSTWILTVIVNVNPLMRYDGYYILSDLLDVPNLQQRGFALARWWLREKLFGFGEPPPETLPPHTRRAVLAYALCTMVYRFALFTGIAVVVYRLAFFKALGLFLMAVEIGWFIARPILGELRIWSQRLTRRRPGWRSLLTAAGFCALLAVLVVPWRGTITAPALLRAEHETMLYTDQPGRLITLVASGTRVAQDAPVFRLESPTLLARRTAIHATVLALRARIEGQAFDKRAADTIEVAWQDLGRALAQQRELDAQSAGLVVRAPFAGLVQDVPFMLRHGEWLPRREKLGLLVDPSHATIEAYVAEADLARVHVGATALFYPTNGGAPMTLQVAELAPASTRVLEAPELETLLPVRRDKSGALLPTEAVYRVSLRPQAAGDVTRRLPGHVVIDGDRSSILGGVWRRTMAVVIREADL